MIQSNQVPSDMSSNILCMNMNGTDSVIGGGRCFAA